MRTKNIPALLILWTAILAFNLTTAAQEMESATSSGLVSGSQITLIPGKNFRRNTYRCSPSSNKERDYTLERETMTFRTKVDEYGKTLVCPTNAKGESCYRRAEK